MKRPDHRLFLALAAALSLAGCEAEISGSLDDDADPGSADFSTFVAVGDSLTAGYKDSALYLEGQRDSYPAILAQQFALAGGGAFIQPERLPEATGSFVGIPTTQIGDRLVAKPSGDPSRPKVEAIAPPVPTNLVPMPGMLYSNFGVPGAKSFHLTLNNYGDPAGIAGGTANPFYVRFARSPGPAGSSVIGDAAFRAPTFFILWIGNNDILLNATAGSPGTDNPTFGTGSTDVTPPTGGPVGFDTTYPALVAALKTPTNKGVLINIPKVTSIPYFTTVPYDAIPLDADTANELNTNVADVYDLVLNSAIVTVALDPAEAERRRIRYQAGQNPILISDDTLQDISSQFVGPLAALSALAQARQATPDDLILLPASQKLGEEDTPGNSLTTWGVTLPLLDTDALIPDEITELEKTRGDYNTAIKAQADMSADLLYFDVAALLEDVTDGFSYGSGGVSAAFIQGGAFSLDGVHPTARGYAVVANEIMKVIEQGFGAKLPPVNPDDYSTVFFSP